MFKFGSKFALRGSVFALHAPSFEPGTKNLERSTEDEHEPTRRRSPACYGELWRGLAEAADSKHAAKAGKREPRSVNESY